MWHWGTQVIAGGVTALAGLGGLFQPKQLHDSEGCGQQLPLMERVPRNTLTLPCPTPGTQPPHGETSDPKWVIYSIPLLFAAKYNGKN